MIYKYYKEQQLNCNIEVAWQFFSSPYNLYIITPKKMNFKVLSKDLAKEIFEGMEIEYKVKPILNISMRWKTIITQVNINKSFTDFQEKGPYKLWRHQHEFIENENGVLIKDRLVYEMPNGVIGRFLHYILVKRRIDQIFNYRYQVLETMFNQKNYKS